jgi:hypothetical protein
VLHSAPRLIRSIARLLLLIAALAAVAYGTLQSTFVGYVVAALCSLLWAATAVGSDPAHEIEDLRRLFAAPGARLGRYVIAHPWLTVMAASTGLMVFACFLVTQSPFDLRGDILWLVALLLVPAGAWLHDHGWPLVPRSSATSDAVRAASVNADVVLTH